MIGGGVSMPTARHIPATEAQMRLVLDVSRQLSSCLREDGYEVETPPGLPENALEEPSARIFVTKDGETIPVWIGFH